MGSVLLFVVLLGIAVAVSVLVLKSKKNFEQASSHEVVEVAPKNEESKEASKAKKPAVKKAAKKVVKNK